MLRRIPPLRDERTTTAHLALACARPQVAASLAPDSPPAAAASDATEVAWASPERVGELERGGLATEGSGAVAAEAAARFGGEVLRWHGERATKGEARGGASGETRR